MNAHDTIIQAVLAALRASPAVAELVEEELDSTAIPEDAQLAVSVSLEGSVPMNPNSIFGHPVDWLSSVKIECYARRDSATTLAGRASRELHATVYQRLMQDPSIGGHADDVREPTIGMDNAVLDTRMGCCTGTYPVQHRTAARNLHGTP